ncbi:hypothetical protein LAZ67_14003397 [Cordylochernes scorpioides]|uniref:Reverse transcriptase domain-containing protein n=1 Tax=Cordylochernes scorpioides TaxID=51811 RepID=A0ABY6L7K6_9ARAC|nr:hypothetical protein LAZ67_14003397 [Cordylochernes scorpioides]
MDKLKRERTPLRNTITRTTNEIKSGLSLVEVDIILIRAKFERLTVLNDRLILIDDKIKEILLDDPRSTEAQINDEMELCETYSLQVGIVAQKVKEYESKLAAPCDDKMSQSSTSDVKRQIKLPKFELKKYTGELEEWLSWWSHFEKIHLDESLSDVDKFEYLIQSMVVGSKAHRLVTSFPLTQKNYNKVIGDLKDRFGDRDMLTELYVRKLLKLVIASARSEKRTLAQLYDDLVAHLHSLGSLGVDTKSGGGAFLYPLVESSLPLELIKIWQRSRTPYIEAGIENSGAKAFDKLEGLIEFLKQEVKNAERISFVAEGFEPSLPLKQGKRENNPPKIHTASALFVGKTNLPCLFCDKDNHLSQNCFKAAKMLESDRLKRVQDAKVCFKCLRNNHLKKDCRSFVRCKRCQGPHFEIMCRGTSHSQENLNWRSDNRSHNSLAEQNEGISEPVTAMANQVCTNNISLMTLIVKLKGPKRSKMVRVLLDSGSQKSYIRRSLAKELDLPKVGEVKLNKFLFGGQTTGEKAHSIFYFQLDNVDKGKAFKMEALEETIICGNISPVETGPRQWELDKKGITLTKVDNNKNEIDILIGGDYYGQLLTGKIEQLAGGLTAIQTVLGWTLIGNTSSERPETSAQMVITLLTTQQRVTSLRELETIGIRDPTEVISEKEKNVLMQENQRRLEAMTQKLTQKVQFVPYDEVFRSWFRENLIEEVDGEGIKPIGHYLPHRPIYKVQSETTPIRPVYDASCKASKRSLSLNECLETGPNLIELLPEILIRFREKKIGAIADIRKAFQTLGIEEKERFHKEYLAMLVQKGNETEGRRFLPGEVVLIGRDDQKRIFWPLGRILELYPGKDGRERVARVRTATGEFVRPLKRLFSLELGSDISREVRLPKTEGIKAQEIPTDGEQSIFTRSGREVKKPTRLGVPERPSILLPTGEELSPKDINMKKTIEISSNNQKDANPPAGDMHVNPAAARGDVTAPKTAATTSATSASPASLNWAESEMAEVNDNEGFIVVKGKKRRLGSTSPEHAARQPNKPGNQRSSQQQKRPTGPRAVPPKEIKATRANIADARARQATTNHENYIFVELCPDIPDYSYLRAIGDLVGGPKNIVHFGRMNGHYIVGLASKNLASRLVEEGLNIEGTLLKVFPFRKRAERIIVANLPGFVEDATIVQALRQYGDITSIAPIMIKMGEFAFSDGRREAFILLHQGVRLETLPARLTIQATAELAAHRSPGKRTAAPGKQRLPSTQGLPPSSSSAAKEAGTGARNTGVPCPTGENINRPAHAALPAPLAVPRPLEPRISPLDHEMSVEKLTSPPSTPARGKAALEQLLEHLKKSPNISIDWDKLPDLNREEAQKLLTSETTMKRRAPTLTPAQVKALNKLHDTIKPLCPDSNSTIRKTLQKTRKETNAFHLGSGQDLCLSYSAVVLAHPVAISGSGLACVFGPGVAVLHQRILWPGHIALATIDVRGEEMTAIAVHLAHEPRERNRQLELLAATAAQEEEGACWIIGDFNIRDRGPSSSSSSDALAALLDLAALVDVATQFDAAHLPTRVAMHGDQVESNRLDRILVPAGVGPPTTAVFSPTQPRLAAMLRSGLALEHLAGYIRELEEDTARDDDDGTFWDRWTSIKAGLLAEARSLHDPRHAASDSYVYRARRYIAAQLEASSIRADYPSLPDLARAIRLRRPVSVIRDEEDNVIEGPELRRRAFATFQPRFARPTSDPAAGAAFIASSAPTTTTRELSEEDPLHRPDISPSEIAHAIEHLPRGKAPGWDGLPCELLVAFNEDFFAEALARVFPASRLRGLSRCPRPTTGVLAAILQRRLKPHLRTLVPESQTYAVPGRSPSWNIAMVTDAVEEATALGSPLAVMGVDLESAFDSLDRGFLESLLTSLRLPPAFRAWINILYAGADATIRAGGFYTTAFPLLNGLRQGCAVSAALFSIATGPLLRRLELTLGVGNVIAYADDIVLLFHRDGDFERVATVFEEYKQASGVGVNLQKSAYSGAAPGATAATPHSAPPGRPPPSGSSGSTSPPGAPSPTGSSISWPSWRLRAADGRPSPAAYPSSDEQERRTRWWGPRSSTTCMDTSHHPRPSPSCRPDWRVAIGGLGLLDLATQLQLACLKGVQVALRGGRNAFSWLVSGNSGEAWIHPPPDGTRLQPRRLRLLKLWEEASNILGLNHRAVPTAQLLDLNIIGGCRFLRPPDLLSPARWSGARVRDLIEEEHLIARPTRSALADAAALGAFCRRLTSENAVGFGAESAPSSSSLAAAVVLRGTATPFLNGLTTRSARRALDRPRLAATPISRFLARWTPTINPPSRIDWASLRRCTYSGHEADAALKLALHALPHPAHPASVGPSCPACGSIDRSLSHRYWCCRSIRLLIRETFNIIGRPPDLQAWIFGGSGLEDDALSILASAKLRIYRYFVQVGLGEAVEDPLIAWSRTLQRRERSPHLSHLYPGIFLGTKRANNILSAFKRGLYDECCVNGCSYEHIRLDRLIVLVKAPNPGIQDEHRSADQVPKRPSNLSQAGEELAPKNGNLKNFNENSSEFQKYANPPEGDMHANLAAARGDVTAPPTAASTSATTPNPTSLNWADSEMAEVDANDGYTVPPAVEAANRAESSAASGDQGDTRQHRRRQGEAGHYKPSPFPFRKRAERIVVANLPGFVEDSTIATALGQFGRVTSITPILVKMGEFTFTDGRREAFILLHEGVRLETLPTRLTIQSKGDTLANCPALARQGNSSPRQAASPTDARPPLPPPQRPRKPAPAPATPASPVQPAKTSTEAQAIPSAHQPAEQMDVTHPAPAAHPASLAAPRPPEPRISPLDHEMSVEKLTSPPSTPAREESALKQLLKHIEETPTLSIDWDKLPGLNCKDAQQLLTSETTMRRLAPTLTEAQVATLDKLHDTFKASCPDSNSTIRKPLQKTRKETNAFHLGSGQDLCLGYSAVVLAYPVAISGSGLACVFGPGVAVLQQRILWPGHIALATIDVHGEEMTAIAVHLAHEPRERNRQLELLAATAAQEEEGACWIIGDFNIRDRGPSSSSSSKALAALLDLAALVDVATQFDAAHLPTRVAMHGDQVESNRLDRILAPGGVLDRVSIYATSHYHLSDHRLVLLQVSPPTSAVSSPTQPRLAAMLRSGLVLDHLAGYIRELEEEMTHDDNDGNLWDRWTTIKAGLLAEARSLHDPRHAARDSYIYRARRYIAAQLEASSIRADYPSLPDLARAIRLRRPVSVIRDEQDNIIESPELRRRAFATFQPRFARPTSDPAAGAAFIASSAPTTTRDLSEEDPLHRPDISPSEIANAIEHLPRGKAPGWDGLPCELLVAFSEDFFAEALARVFAASRLRGALPPSTRRSSICLVPKARGGRGLDGYRPVALPSSDYRVLAAILHRRLKPYLRTLVPECQTYAVPGRSPSWNIAMVTDAIEEATALGVDLESAFDSLDRGFLESLLTSLRLPPAFRAWINILYAGADATLRAGGFYTAAFPLLNGLRQGCAVSAPLFSIATRPLLRRLKLTLGVGNVIAYADDIVLLLHRDGDFERVATVFEEYNQASGVGVNLRKSAGLWCGAWRNRGDSPLGAFWSTTSIRILGLDIAPRSTVAHREQHLLALLETACRRWTPFTRGLSLVGRARAANTLVGSTI